MISKKTLYRWAVALVFSVLTVTWTVLAVGNSGNRSIVDSIVAITMAAVAVYGWYVSLRPS
jgi:succinate-acetate transporter protein